MSALCLTLAERHPWILNEKIRIFAGRVAFVEVRLDYLADPGELPRLPDTPTRFIATCRSAGQGGRFDGPECERLKILERSAGAGFSWIDLEREASVDTSIFQGVPVLRSHHDFSACSRELAQLYEEMRRLPGQAVKIAVTPGDGRESVRILKWMEGLPEDHLRVILGMGRLGQPTRVLGPLVGSLWTYVVEDAGHTVAPGQFTLREASDVLRYGAWSAAAGRPSFYVVLTRTDVGFRLCRILNRLFEARGLESACLPLVVEDVKPWLEYFSGSMLSIQGLAVVGELARTTPELPEGPGGPLKEAMDSVRRSADGWEAGETGVAFDLPETMAASPESVWTDWLVAQFRFWTGSEANRDVLESGLEAVLEDRRGGSFDG